MKHTFNKDRSIASQLSSIVSISSIVSSVFPKASNTGHTNDLISVNPDPKSKGKAVWFTWKKAKLRLTENIKLQELNFCNTLEETEVSKEALAMIEKCLRGIQTTQPQTTQAEVTKATTVTA